MEWSDDVSAGAWLQQSADGVPRGYRAYARIPHADGTEGQLDAATLAAIVTIAAAHTRTPDRAWIAIWDGWGGVLGFFGDTPARTFLAFADEEPDDAVEARHRQMLQRSIHDPVNNVFRKPVWQSGILSDEISRGPRLEAGGHDHVLFRGGLAELTDAAWAERVPWAERVTEWTASPSLLWPDDRAWVLVTDPDADTTVVAGPEALIAALIEDARMDASRTAAPS
ncbi:hypothetical protein ABCS02_12730 [Microbacterium sp. X-17]|uniref:hypothetical protein n=1 Tax=Microbacterium sp. X-17 TaxID=3144404 RepID=UPI0031F55C59